jgi:PAS domain S-box-containing protein
MVAADALTALAYLSIPLAIWSYLRRRGGDLGKLGWVPWLFVGFISACGLTHLLDIWTIWVPDYQWQAAAKTVTAGLSLVTALALWPLLPKALAIPSTADLQRVIAELEAEVARRRSAEVQTADVEQQLSLTLSSIDAGFLATDADGCVTRLNGVAERLTGWRQAEALGRPCFEVFDREDRPLSMNALNPIDVMRAQAVTIDQIHRIVIVARTGQRTAAEVRASLTHDDNGRVGGMMMVFRDITRLDRAEAEMRRLAAIVESSSGAIIGKTLSGRITSWNAAAERLFGYRAAEVLGQPIQMLFPPERAAEEMRILVELAQGRSVAPFDTVRLARDGSRLHLSVSISSIRDVSGNIVGASKIARDISAQRHAEAALRTSQRRLGFALEAGRIGDWEVDLSRRTVRRSGWHDRCFGHAQPQADWTLEDWWRQIHPEDRAGTVRGFEHCVAQGGDWHAEARVLWPDGSEHWLALHGTVVQEDDPLPRLLGIVVDVTASRQAERQRMRAERLAAENQQIQAANRLKSQFLANMSHELRTPLNAIIGFSDLLKSGAVPPDSPKRELFLGHISSSGYHLLQLIDDVLDLSKVEAGHMDFYPESLDLPALVGKVCGVLEPSLRNKQLQLTVDLAPELDNLLLDVGRFTQVLNNYLSNAIKFTPEGGQIRVRALAEGAEQFRLEVDDTGVGIATEDLPRLFVEFQQLDGSMSKRHQGTGLGLALIRRLVEAQGGTVGVRSELGRGSVFHVVLPRQPLATGQRARAASLPGPYRLMVLDNGQPVGRRVAQALSREGFDVQLATGETAGADLARDRYDGIVLDLSDIEPPNLDVLARVRGQDVRPQVPVVGLTLDCAAQGHTGFGVTDVLSKPLDSAEVLRALRQAGLLARAGARVLVVDDEAASVALMCATLEAAGMVVQGLQDPTQVVARLQAWPADAIVLDLMMPGCDGLQVLEALHARPGGCELPLFIWSSLVLSDDEYAVLTGSARDLIRQRGGGLDHLLSRLKRWPSREPIAVAGEGAR